MPPVDHARWFGEEVKPHEPALRAYLQARFSSLSDHDDLVQETYVRMLRAKTAGKVRYARALLFSIAHNTALDLFRRHRAAPVEAVTDLVETEVLEKTPVVSDTVVQQEELEILADAVRGLSERCREVVLLRYLEGLSYKDIALRLGVSPETVKTHLATGMRRCAEHFAARGLLKPSSSKEASSA
ncbi:MAG TPA: RNA polymerase sigma factor [Opitutaceae bacterium]|nr:RNA polymerase sigma factor [Opitutaceae bacterium]